MPLTDFVLETEYREGVKRQVRVVVYGTLKGLRIAAARHDNQSVAPARRKRGEFADTLGICHRFEWQDADGESRPDCAIVRLATPHLGIGILSHELAHAAVWIRELDDDPDPLTTADDEQFCWVLGDLVSQATATMFERGIYT